MMSFLLGPSRRLPEQDCLKFSNAAYPYRIRASDRRRTLALELRADGTLTVAAPAACPLAVIREFVASQKSWIDRKRQLLASRQRTKAELAPGMALPYLGTHLLLQRQPVTGSPATCRREDNRLVVQVARADDMHRVVERWYRDAAATHFRNRISYFSVPLGCAPTRLIVRAARTRWGSCSARGTISLNWRLMQAPPELVDYVVVHELCHLRVPNHSPRFWSEVARILPHWRDLREALQNPQHWLVF